MVADPPVTSDLPFRALVSYKTFLANSGVWGLRDLRGWGWSITTQLLLAKKDVMAVSYSWTTPYDEQPAAGIRLPGPYRDRGLSDDGTDRRCAGVDNGRL